MKEAHKSNASSVLAIQAWNVCTPTSGKIFADDSRREKEKI
jgi:hypothetical protein